MITELYEKVAAGLKEIQDCIVYQEEVPQNIQKPCFLICFYDQDPTTGINGRLKNSIKTDITYFPEVTESTREELWRIGQELCWSFTAQNCRIKNRSLKMEKELLHFMFEVHCGVTKPDHTDKMQDMSQKTKWKQQ